MATFYGGDQLVDQVDLTSQFESTIVQEIDIYTVPSGHYGIVRRATIAAEAQSVSYSIDLVAPNLFEDAENYQEEVSVAGDDSSATFQVDILSQMSRFRDGGTYGNGLFMNAGEKLIFNSVTAANNQIRYNIIIDLYKKP